MFFFDIAMVSNVNLLLHAVDYFLIVHFFQKACFNVFSDFLSACFSSGYTGKNYFRIFQTNF